ncbi:MAG: hypothetical protein F4X26_11850 [Chloroflexi bacterium]|nr:hypothetical protein [Chloroflexota bacterium]
MSNARTLAVPGLVASVFMLVLASALPGPVPAAAQDLSVFPADLYGTGLPDGTVVAAHIGSTECESTVVEDGVWLIRLYPDDCDGLAVSGARVTFTVDGMQADQYVLWQASYSPPNQTTGIVLTVGSGVPVAVGPVDPDGPPEPPRLSRNRGLAIFSGGSLDDLEAAALAACPGGVTIWANDPDPEGDYLIFRPNPPIPLINVPFRTVYPDGFDGPEPVIITDCVTAGGF